MTGECMACMQPTDGTLTPCKHSMCASCALQWVQRKETCPMCRGVILALPGPPPRNTVLIDIPKPCMHVGITVRTSETGRGVRVVSLDPNDRAKKCGLRKGDVITHLNGIPVRDHRIAVAITNGATQCGVSLHCTLQRRDACWLRWCVW